MLKLLQSHREFEYDSCDRQIVEQDAAEVLPFIESELNQDSYSHCAFVQGYLDSLSRKNVVFDDFLQQGFKSEAYQLAEVLLDDRAERSEMGWEQYQEQKRKRIKEHFANYEREDYERFFGYYAEIWNSQERSHKTHEFRARIVEILLDLASDKPGLFAEVLEAYLKQGDPLNLADYYRSGNLVARLIEIWGDNRTYQLLTRSEYDLRKKWLSFFYDLAIGKDHGRACHTTLFVISDWRVWGTSAWFAFCLTIKLPMNAFSLKSQRPL